MRIRAVDNETNAIRFFDTDWNDSYCQIRSWGPKEYLFYVEAAFYRVVQRYVDLDTYEWDFERLVPMDAAAWLLDFNLEPSNLVANCLAAEFAELTFGRIAFQMGDCDREVTVGGEESTTMESAENSDVGLGFSFGPEASCAATSALANADLKTEWLLESRNLIKQYDNGEKPKRVLVKRVRNWFTREWDRLWASGVPWWKEFALSEQQELLGLRVRFQEIWNASRHK